MNAPPGDPDIVAATSAGRWLAAAGIVAVIVLMVVFQRFIWPLFEAAFAATADAAAIDRLRNAAAGMAAVGIGCAAYLLFYGRAVLASGRNPPPTARMWRATRITRGDAARRFGWLYLACGIVALFACIGLVATLHHSLANLPPDDHGGISAVPAVDTAGAAASSR